MYLTVIHYDPIEYRGYVKPIPPQSGTGGGGDGGCGGYPDPDYMTSIAPADPEYGVFADDYDPYYPDCGGSGGGSGGSGSGGGGGGGDWGGMTFPEMCSSLGGKLYYDFYCLELWNDKTGNYETVWCGTGATCET